MEGDSPYRLAPGGVQTEAEELEAEDSSSEEGPGAAVGRVYRVFRGQLRLLEGGMERYEEIASRAAAKLGKA